VRREAESNSMMEVALVTGLHAESVHWPGIIKSSNNSPLKGEAAVRMHGHSYMTNQSRTVHEHGYQICQQEL